MQLDGRVALVTGAGEGIGRATALLLASEGAKVAALGRTEDDLRRVVEEIETEGGEAMVVPGDVSDAGQMERAVRRVVDRWGRLDVVFANAGVNGVWAPIEELKVEEWEQTISINLTGTFLTLRYAVPHLKKQGGSVIVNSSINGTRIFNNTGATAYAASKAGQVALAKMLALELARFRIRVNVICPGAIDTSIDENTEQRHLERVKTPMEIPEGEEYPLRGAPGTAEQVARVVLFLASDASAHVSGTELWVDGAESLLGGT